MIRVLFDVVELAPGMGKSMGIYNYALNLYRHILPLLADDVELHVACNAGCAADFGPAGARSVHQHVVSARRTPGTFERQLWMRMGAQALAKRLGCTHYFSPKGFLPGWFGRPMGLTSVVVLHDLIPLWYEVHAPGTFGRLERRVVNGGLLRAARHADELVVISAATADEVQQLAGRPQARMHVVHNGVPFVRPEVARPVDHPYLFAVSSAMPHKNAQGLLDAYACYRERVSDPLPLIVCGLPDMGLPGVTSVRGLSDVALHTYYAHAEVFLFLSLVEGFGFPPVEAMSHGTPVVCSDIASLREVTAGAALLVPPKQPNLVAQQLAALLSEPRALADMRERGPKVAQRYGWVPCAQAVLDVLRGAQPPETISTR